MKRDSVAKTLGQLRVLAMGELYLSPSFWRRYICHHGCGACCRYSFTLDWLPEEREHLFGLYPVLEPLGDWRVVRGTHVWTVSPLGSSCNFLGPDGSCAIHAAKPFSCAIELVRFKRIRNRGYVQKAPYGRAWQMKRLPDDGPVLCQFLDGDLSQLPDDIAVLQRMQDWAEALRVETKLPALLALLEAVASGQQEPSYKMTRI